MTSAHLKFCVSCYIGTGEVQSHVKPLHHKSCLHLKKEKEILYYRTYYYCLLIS